MTNATNGLPTLKDGQAVDQLSDRAERWAKKYKNQSDEKQFLVDFDAKFRPEAAKLAAQCTVGARPFGLKEWIIAVPLWLILGAIVFFGSVLLMQPTGVWFWVFLVVAVLIAIVGIAYVYYDTTSEKRAAKRLADKVDWLLGVSRKTATDTIRGVTKG
ncbi:SdpI family protein [Gulosibacter molinativorax]|uniref:Phage holin family protein n=1 Tax=Gulosibacter molinativorax TaxID=256821 RepID=A0ABT7C9H9_9MICO|nr:SdpI family protein [Gulosibacter molinativorax]MDJ1371853.1 hypothetical protein [Gulosibacter molinativorax]QUY60775.1 Hypotetical protein [Gulosibacter molinativorax]